MKKKQWLSEIFNLRRDQERANVIDIEIRAGVTLTGTNLWVLIFAILIASIGLNVNSTAVIIGAMLISPLMGPIVGIGYGAGIYDLQLIKLSVRNWLICIIISLVSATLYFTLTPLTQAQSELLARTQPTLWDVLIAFFGGCAGIVAMTRKNISNVIPGVAIATALMPPLCTAGYGIAIGNWAYFGGAFYLFSINSVFIAFATLLFTRILKLPIRGQMDEKLLSFSRAVIIFCTLGLMIPSSFLAYRLVREEMFVTRANQLLLEINRSKNIILLSHLIEADARHVKLIVGGNHPPQGLQEALIEKLSAAGVQNPSVEVVYAGSNPINVDSIKQDLEQSLYQNTAQQLNLQAERIKQLEAENLDFQSHQTDINKTLQELRAQFPEAKRISLTLGSVSPQETVSETVALQPVIVLWLETNQIITATEQQRLQRWLAVRFAGQGEVQLHNTVSKTRITRKK